ncbi:hypothetical protein [Paludisphaera rhizosphaerae]|uniref:hypothetical protein n=1 Tax=Paludisphaera rhizosphaerae TaxID=2711216 RepID=UPI0013EDD593|nr:hypothetical protein [Paludisphaera rhizosphaerae]
MATAQEVHDWIEKFVHGFDFTRPGLDRSLGRDIAHEVAGQIAARSSILQDPDGQDWDENEPMYRKRKQRSYGWDHAPNYRTGQMLSHASLFGDPIVEARTIVMVYGTGDPPGGIWSPHDNRSASEKRQDEAVTDREKAAWATEGDAQNNRPARPFYAVDDSIRAAVIEICADALREYLITGS